jgi:DNA adenine methylase
MPRKPPTATVTGGARQLPPSDETRDATTDGPVRFLRYPGGKQRLLHRLIRLLPHKDKIKGRLVEPFVGGGAVFYALDPDRALLTDLNAELIDLYRGIRRYPAEVWKHFSRFPSSKEGYYQVRGLDHECLGLAEKAARTLYLSRTCFKGMWRHNSTGQFNVGYGGQDRRWAICEESVREVSRRLRKARLRCCDFEETIAECEPGDFLYLDPPYKPGERDIFNDHYAWSRFRYADHERLAETLRKATARGIVWAMTTTSHLDVVKLYPATRIIPLAKGRRAKSTILKTSTGEVVIFNGEEAQ